MYKLIIVGGGPAAISAGIYAARKRINTLLITKDWNGQMNWTNLVENYPGFRSIAGPDLLSKMIAHLENYRGEDFNIAEDQKAEKVVVNKDGFLSIKTETEEYQTKTAVIATGRRYKKLGLPGEAEFANKGVSYCPTCDAPLFKDKTVAVIGGGNAGAETALDLLKYAREIYLITKSSRLECDECFSERLKEAEKVKLIFNARTSEIKGSQFVEELVYSDLENEQKEKIAVEGVFVEIGTVANSSLLKNVVELNQAEEIVIDQHNKTSQENIFAAGDATNIPHKQIIIAAGEGAKAVLSVYKQLNRQGD